MVLVAALGLNSAQNRSKPWHATPSEENTSTCEQQWRPSTAQPANRVVWSGLSSLVLLFGWFCFVVFWFSLCFGPDLTSDCVMVPTPLSTPKSGTLQLHLRNSFISTTMCDDLARATEAQDGKKLLSLQQQVLQLTTAKATLDDVQKLVHETTLYNFTSAQDRRTLSTAQSCLDSLRIRLEAHANTVEETVKTEASVTHSMSETGNSGSTSASCGTIS